MRVCTAKQMAAIDRETIAGGIAGEALMERAGQAMTEALLGFLDETESGAEDHDHGTDGEGGPGVLVICGKGNNAGDGLVVARLTAQQQCSVTVMLLSDPDELRTEAMLNFGRLPENVTVAIPPADLWPEVFEELAEEATIVVDAIFGTGVKPPLRGPYVDLIRAVNDAGMPCLSLDVPSGVSGDDGRVDPVAMAADLTVTVGLPKLGLLLAPGRDFAGDIEVVDIGFPDDICRKHASELNWLPREDYLAMLPPRPGTTHKYKTGRMLIVAGSRDYGGAAHLAGLGALRSGAGLVVMAVPLCLETVTRVILPEAVTRAVAETDAGTIAPLSQTVMDSMIENQRALAVGPGLGADPATDSWVVDLVKNLALPMVVDADALSAFARIGAEPAFGSDQVVLTPHAGELARMTGLSSKEIESRRLQLTGELAARWNVVLMLKGSPSLIGAPDGRVFINPAGDDALARGGSGDVLTGLVGGLLAQGTGALEAALLGAYLHGQAGTVAARGRSNRSVLVREIAAAIGPVFEEMEKEASATSSLREKIWPINPEATP
ncbi:MAG: NAD(P)H-hydrate dehydratase [Candidatus Krumholzibacteria bacterium]|nr:NAD(P)H-hydrate dehydratase [Candidatus Krumholzibacteria bacterium]